MRLSTLFALFAAALSTCLLAGQPALADETTTPEPPAAASAEQGEADSTAPAEDGSTAPAEEFSLEGLDPSAMELSDEQMAELFNSLFAMMGEMPMMPEMPAMTAPSSYYISKTVDMGFDDTVMKLKEALAAEKFAVLTEIDLKAKFKEKLDVDIPRYTIFGACGAKWAHAIWEKEFHIGALMPCNVVVAELPDGRTEVFFKDPGQLPMATGNPEIAETAATVGESVRRILEAI